MKNKLCLQIWAVMCAVMLLSGASNAWAGSGSVMAISFPGYTNRTEVLTNFPVLVSFSNGCDSAGRFRYSSFLSTNGYDLRFRDAGDTVDLNYEIEDWNTNGVSIVWVQVPEIPGDGTGSILAKWGSETDQLPCTTNGTVWANGYVGVWHLNAFTGGAYDSTSNRNNGVVTGVTAGTGVVGRCGNFSGSAYITCANQAYYNSNDMVTASLWVKCEPAGWARDWQMFMTKGVDTFWDLRRFSNTDQISFCLNNGNSSGPATTFQNGAWHMLTGVYRKSPLEARIYIDGRQYASFTPPASLTASTAPLQISGRQGNNYCHRGLIDEVQVSRAYWSSNWVWAAYMTYGSNGLFTAYGGVQPVDMITPDIYNGTPSGITLNSADLNGALVINGASTATVSVYWGPADGGTNAADWSNVTTFAAGRWADDSLPTTNIATLNSNTLYYYCYYASNDAASAWATPAEAFINGGVGIQKTADAFEPGLSPGTFTVYRASSATNVALTLTYARTGTAVSGTDFVALPGSITIPAGATTALIVVTPLATPANGNDRTLDLTLTAGSPLCLFDAATNATLSIASTLATGATVSYADVKWTGVEIGTATHPFRTLSNAVARAIAAGAALYTVYVAGGTNADVANGGLEDFSASGGTGGGIPITRQLRLYGGYAGYDGVSAFDWTAGARVPRSSIIDLQGAKSRAFYVSYSGSSTLFDGFTFRNANVTTAGSAIHAWNGTYGYGGCNVNNCLFTNNVTTSSGTLCNVPSYQECYILNSDFINNRAGNAGAVRWGGGNYAAGYKAITNCTFIGNVATDASEGGGAIMVDNGGGTILNCTFSNNAAGKSGGAVFPKDGNTTFKRCGFFNNTAPYGAAIGGGNGQYNAGGANIENCLIVGNTNGYAVDYSGHVGISFSVDMNFSTVANNPGGGVRAYANSGATPLRIRNSIIVSNGGYGIVHANTNYTYSFANNDVFGHTTSNYYRCLPDAGSILANPEFIDPVADFRLAANSPCIEIATNTGVTVDLPGTQRPTRNGYDLGCYEERSAIRVGNLSPVMSSTNATLRGQMIHDGNTNAIVTIFWGPTDGGTTNSNWMYSNVVGVVAAPNTFQAIVDAVVPDNTYWFRCFASNWYGGVWADESMSFDIPSSGLTKLWTGAGTNALASNPSNWFDNVSPTESDTIKFDNVSSNAIWDAAAPHSVASWVQTLNYTGTVTIGSGWSNGFDALTISNNMTISGGRLTHLANPANGTAVYRLKLNVLGNLTLSGSGINVDGLGYVARKGPGAATLSGRAGSHGGEGYSHTNPVTLYGSLTQPEELGSGGYDYNGGGAVYLDVGGTATVSAAISANNAVSGWSACGAGGSIFLRAGTLVGSGTVSADGQMTSGVASSGGGGGRIAVILTSNTGFDAIRMHAYGGSSDGDAKVGAAGTVYKETTAHLPGQGILVIDNGNQIVRWARTVIPTNDLANVTQIVITNRGVLGFAPGTVFDFGDLSKISGAGAGVAFITVRDLAGITFPAPFTIAGYTLRLDTNLTAVGDWTIATNGGLSHSFNEDVASFSLNLNLTGNLIVNGSIDLRGGGYPVTAHASVGPGFTASCGGSYGGLGYGALSNKTYGSILQPRHLGSGADSPGGGATITGGGKATLSVSGNSVINGSILVGSLEGNQICGSGGSLYLVTGTLSGTGLVSAAGGCTAGPLFSEIGGGGGRIAVKLNTGTGFGSVRFTAQGGLAGAGNSRGTGSAGTIYLETATDGAGAGQVILDNGTVGANTNGTQWTELPGGRSGYPFTDDLSLTRVVMTNLTMVRLTTNVLVGSLTLNANSRLELAGYTGTVSFLTITNYSYVGGNYAASDLGGLVSDSSGGSGRVLVLTPPRGTVYKVR